jgi:hypothetical protein
MVARAWQSAFISRRDGDVPWMAAAPSPRPAIDGEEEKLGGS